MKSDYQLTDPRFPYVNADRTNIGERFRKEGFTPPEQAAAEQEQESRIEGALRVMKKLRAGGSTDLLERRERRFDVTK